MKTLVFCGPSVGASAVRGEHRVRVALDERAAVRLSRAGLPHRRMEELLGPSAVDDLDEAAMTWSKGLGRKPLVDGHPLRELRFWRGISLWWFAEIYIYHCTRMPHRVRRIEAIERVLAAEHPDEVEAAGLAVADEVLLGRVCTARGVLFHGRLRAPRLRSRLRVLGVSLASRRNTVKTVATGLKALLSGSPPRPAASEERTILFLSHAAFWKTRRDPVTGRPIAYEQYFDRLIPEVDRSEGLRSFIVSIGPKAPFRRRRLADRLGDWLRPHVRQGRAIPISRYTRPGVVRSVVGATRAIRSTWRQLARSSGLFDAVSYHGVPFADLVAPDIAATMLLQLPWAVRSIEETLAVLAAARPAAACLYAESSGWGRAALAACRVASVPSLAIQHGILYPKYFSLRHDADDEACPRPDVTAVFGESARRLLWAIGHNRPESLVATGNPKFDDLVRASRAWDRAALRARLGVPEGEHLVVVASRFRAIRDTHQSIGPVFPGFVRAIEGLPGVTALVKPHPAEPPRGYQAVLDDQAATSVRLLPAGADLMELLHAADALVTVESASAFEALILGRPVVILNMPTHLAELVEQGVAVGVGANEDPAPVLSAVLLDPALRGRLAHARDAYVSDLAMGADGEATARILDLLRATAADGRRGSVGAA